MTLAEMSLKRPVTVIMVFVSMMVVGLIAAFRLPLEAMPDVQFPFMCVDAPYPGSTPSEVERTITRPIEDALSTLTGIKNMNSSSGPEGSQICFEFKWGQDATIKAVEARNKIDAIRADLPSDLRRFKVQKWATADQAVLGMLISSGRDLNNAYELLDHQLKRPLERVPGVARVRLFGVQQREVQIEISSDRLTAAGVSLNELYDKLSTANFSASAGLVKDGDLRYHVQPQGEWRSVEDIRSLAINDRGLKLGDIADVTLKPERKDYDLRLDQRPSVILKVYKERQANLVDTVHSVWAEIDRIQKSGQIGDLKLIAFDDQAAGVTDSLKQLSQAGLEGTLLSVIVLFFFLRDWPSTLMVSLAIPICFIITLGCMQMFGVTLNILSMMGLLLAVGMLVDNAVVVVESIYQYREKYPDKPWYCAVQGTQIVGIAIAAGTLASIIVFLPMVLREKNEISIYLTQVAVAMAIAHLASWLVAVSLVPMLSARLPPPKFIGRKTVITRAQEGYGKLIALTLAHRRWTALGVIALMVVSFVPITQTKVDMNGGGNSKFVFMRMNYNGLYNLRELRESYSRIENWLNERRQELKIKSIYDFYNETGDSEMIVFLEDKADSNVLAEALRKNLPKVPVGEVTIGFGGGGGQGSGVPTVGINLTGDSGAQLRELGDSVIPILRSLPSLRDVRASQNNGNQELSVRIDRQKAKTMGFSASDIAQYIGIALRGFQLKDFHGGEGQIPVWLRFAGSDTQSLDKLSEFKLRRADGTQVPLMSMVDVSTNNAAATIDRNNRQTTLGIVANFAEGKTPEDARKDIEAAMSKMELPPGYKWSFGQNFDREDEAGSTMLWNTLIALVLVYVVMCAMFESLIYPAAILTTFLFSILGVFWLFWITGTTFSIMASIGVLILMGVVVNNGIVMIVHINQLRHDGLDRRVALVQGAKDRLRPILMTMGTAILGMLPLCLGSAAIGGDGPPYYPMARAIAGGLIFSTLISLLVLPTIYSLLDDASLWAKRVLRDARVRRWRPA
ncbi:MAG: efflux RND transporter permease subunit [Rudaea sp.]|uniref:efflux RND transporter permease subunit n=1 Tax=unclassified Rudaea TaxID=2627037 RepID=UPI0010F60DDB|nr:MULTISPECIES: efflux RND transporter permease subunit [unclassified Rudaea]MBN8884893.1 efflux RND transporter permease subunit [Rudaea sp.]MBR0344661.1 efflux RND transporter permease subunit [Rudaea sp.]